MLSLCYGEINMISTVEKFINTRQLLKPGDKIAVAVSGGPDSTALLLVLHQLAKRYRWTLLAAHVNYHARGADSDRDEKFVRQLSSRLKLPVVVTQARLDVAGSGFEERARDFRYAFFRDLVERGRVNKIAVAHTADDQAETIVLNMLRGSGLRGAAGMPVARDLIIRPLLAVRRSALQRWLAAGRQSYRRDRSNRDLHFQRNWIRWRLLPYLRHQDKNFDSRLVQAGRAFGRAADYLERQALRQLRLLKISEQKNYTKYLLKPFLEQPEILQGEMVRALLGRRDITRQHIREVLAVLEKNESGKRKAFKGREIIRQKSAFICRHLPVFPALVSRRKIAD